MPSVLTYDVAGGDTMKQFVCADGYRLPVFEDDDDVMQSIIDNMPDIPCRDDDILINSYVKTGTNWLYEMLTMIVAGKPEYCAHTKGPTMLETKLASNFESHSSPRLLNTHVKVRYIPKEAREKKIRCILLARNPKDLAVSFYNHTIGFKVYHYTGKFPNYLQLFMRGEVDYGPYQDYMYEWQEYIRAHPDWPVHVIYYEDMKEDCLGELVKLCRYLRLDVRKEFLSEVATACTIDNLKANKPKKHSDDIKAIFDRIAINGVNVLFRKGQIGDWKNWFTVSQSEQFDEWWKRETKKLDMFTFRYTPSSTKNIPTSRAFHSLEQVTFTK